MNTTGTKGPFPATDPSTSRDNSFTPDLSQESEVKVDLLVPVVVPHGTKGLLPHHYGVVAVGQGLLVPVSEPNRD